MFDWIRRKKSKKKLKEESTTDENLEIYWKKNPNLNDHTQWFKVINDAPRRSDSIYVHRVVIINGVKQFYMHYVTKRWFKEKGFVRCSPEEYNNELKSGIY